MGHDGAFVQFELPLEKGERQLWSGTPPQGVFDARYSVLSLLVPVGFVGWAFYTGDMGLFRGSTLETVSTLIGIVFVGAVFILPIGLDWLRRRATVYGITNERAIIIARGKTESLYHVEIHTVERRDDRNGRGWILFGEDEEVDTIRIGSVPVKFGNRQGKRAPRFERIADVAAVHKILEDARRIARAPARVAPTPSKDQT